MRRARFDYSRANPCQLALQHDLISKFIHVSGGYGSGKTYGLLAKALQLSAINKLSGGLVCPSFPEYKKDVLPLFEEILDQNKIKYIYHKTDHWFQFPWSKAKLYVVTAERKIKGPNWAFACINEVTLIPLERYKEIIARVRLKTAKLMQVVSVGTPEGFANEYFEYFIEKPFPGLRVIYGNTRENLHNLNEDYVSNLENSYDAISLQTYLDGQWMNMSGRRFYYSYSAQKNHDLNIKRIDWEPAHISMDFNVDPMTCTMWHYVGGMLLGFDQIELSGPQGYDTKKLCDAIKARGYDPNDCIIYPDPAGNARTTKGMPDHEILRTNGFHNIRVKSAAPRMRERQLNVNNLLDKRIIRFHPDNCPGIKRDMMHVEQNIITLEKEKANPKLTHFSDGLDYLCDILYPFSGKKPETRTTKRM